MRRILVLAALLGACQSDPPAPAPLSSIKPSASQPNSATSEVSPTVAQSASETPSIEKSTASPSISPEESPTFQGYLEFPYRAADAGNFSLQAGQVITLSWQDAPQSIGPYEFSFVPDVSGEPIAIGIDHQESDGVSVDWVVPEHLAGRFQAITYLASGEEVRAGPSGAIYSGEMPPEGVCSLSSSFGAVDVFAEPSREAEVLAVLIPGSYATVQERKSDGWYLVDASQALDMASGQAAEGSGWITDLFSIELHGECENVPITEP